jgi:hypothetical protein
LDEKRRKVLDGYRKFEHNLADMQRSRHHFVLLRSGDLPAFVKLTHRFQHFAFGSALALVGDFHHAEDVVQEALVAAWSALPRLADPPITRDGDAKDLCLPRRNYVAFASDRHGDRPPKKWSTPSYGFLAREGGPGCQGSNTRRKEIVAKLRQVDVLTSP